MTLLLVLSAPTVLAVAVVAVVYVAGLAAQQRRYL